MKDPVAIYCHPRASRDHFMMDTSQLLPDPDTSKHRFRGDDYDHGLPGDRESLDVGVGLHCLDDALLVAQARILDATER